jgi:hypothetical protein
MLTLNSIPRGSWSDGKRLHITRTVVPSGNYVTGGDILPFNTSNILSAHAPTWGNVDGTAITKYAYNLVIGTSFTNNKMTIVDTTTGLELAAGAYPAAILSDSILFYGIFQAGI